MQPMFHDSRMFSLRRRRLRLAHNRFSALLCCCCCCCCCCALLVTSKLVYYVSQGSANQGSPPNRDPVVADLAPPTTIEDLHFIAYELNRQQAVHHEDEFGPLTPSDPVIVVQVHNRWRYLKLLLRSLSLVKGIDRALLILSHDYYDAHAHNLSKTVTFCKVMQIYFPYSTQLYPTEFPGTHPNDCPRNMNIEQARKMKCNGANFPDAFGHYRESAFTQIKHHWWWKANFVMESLNATRKHDGPILLLEEDYYVSADYLAAVRLLLANKPKFCGYNICLCMVGNLNNDYRYEKYLLDKVEVRPWANSTNNMGIILTRDTWEVMRGCFGEFCTYDDYNWDLTLTAVARRCLPPGSLTVSLRASRVLHTGRCGIHRHAKSCAMARVRKALRRILPSEGFGSEKMERLYAVKPRQIGVPSMSGGWADIRDQRLCVKMTLWDPKR